LDGSNYRVIKSVDAETRQIWFGLYEVYYDEDGDIFTWTEEPFVTGDNVEDVQQQLEQMLAAVRHMPEALDKTALIAHLDSPKMQAKFAEMRRSAGGAKAWDEFHDWLERGPSSEEPDDASPLS
jgi:hypothetical protein